MQDGYEMFTKMLVSFLILFLLCFAVFSFVAKAIDTYELDKNVAEMKFLSKGSSLKRSSNKHEKSYGDEAYEFFRLWWVINDW